MVVEETDNHETTNKKYGVGGMGLCRAWEEERLIDNNEGRAIWAETGVVWTSILSLGRSCRQRNPPVPRPWDANKLGVLCSRKWTGTRSVTMGLVDQGKKFIFYSNGQGKPLKGLDTAGQSYDLPDTCKEQNKTKNALWLLCRGYTVGDKSRREQQVRRQLSKLYFCRGYFVAVSHHLAPGWTGVYYVKIRWNTGQQLLTGSGYVDWQRSASPRYAIAF